MNKLYIINNNKLQFVDELEVEFAINDVQYDFLNNQIIKILPNSIREYLYQKSLLKNKNDKFYLSFDPINCADIYWHRGALTKNAKEAITNAKKVIVSSQAEKYNLINKNIARSDKIEVIYPSWNEQKFDIEHLKQKYFKELNIELTNEKKIVFYTSNNFKTHGLNDFLQLILHMENKDFIPLIACYAQQFSMLNFMLTKYNLQNFVKIHKLSKNESSKEIDELLALSDIFVYPTYASSFATIIVRAMGFRNGVFIPASNAAAEITDHFATMSSPNDATTVHKIEALLSRNDLDYIKDLNLEVAKNFTTAKTFEKLKEIINTLALEH